MNPDPPTPPSRAEPTSPPPPGTAGAGREGDPYNFRPPEALTTLDERGRRKWLYPAEIQGLFMRWRRIAGYLLIVFYFGLPWVHVDGLPAVLLQIPQRRFVLLGHVFWPQDAFYLVFLLVGLALALFFFTALAGRVWCGWACPQTVFMEEIFRKIEWWTEGDHHARRRLDQAPWSAGKVARKLAKHALFLLFSTLVSNTFIAFFVGTDELLRWIISPPDRHWTAFLIMASVLAVFYLDFAWFREQFCTVLCPYARFQAVLTDAHTIQVGYSVVRGEPRGRAGAAKGDCVDCHKCVAVCPTGIDIRDGYQLECIGCARCIDACDSIMARLGRPLRLVGYDSLARLQGEAIHWFRPRVVIYSLLLVGVTVALFVGLGTRALLDLTVLRAPGDPFAVLPGNLVSNHFQLRVHNRGSVDKVYRLALEGPADAHLVVPVNPTLVRAGEQAHVEAFVTLPAGDVPLGRVPLRVRVYEGGVLLAEKPTTFLAPVKP